MDTARRHELLTSYAAGEITAVDLRRQFDNATYAEILRMMADEGLALPQAPVSGREETIRRARDWLFPAHNRG